MPSCLVNKCLSKTGRKGQSREIALHRFPNDPTRIRCWLLQTGQNFQNLESMVKMIHEGQKQTKYWLCSIHFAADAYIHARVLRQDAVPSIFPLVREGESIIQENLKKVRLRAKKRPLEWTSTENMGVQPSGTSADIFPEDADIRQFTWTGNMDAQSSSASANTFPGDTDIKPLRWTTDVDVQSSSTSEDADIKPLQWTLTANMDVQSGALADTIREDVDIKPLRLTLTANRDVQSSSSSMNVFPEDTDIKPLRLTGNTDVQSRTLADTFPEDTDIKPLRLTLTGNMDVQSSKALADTFPKDTDIKPLQWTTNVDIQSPTTSEDTDIKPLQLTLTRNMDVQSSTASLNSFPEDTDIKPLRLTANMAVQSRVLADTFPKDTDLKPLQWTTNVHVKSPSTSEDTDIQPSQLALTAAMNVQSSSTSADIFPEDTDIKPDIKPDISKPSCCTIGTQTEFALCNSTVKFFDQEDKPPADPVVTETPVLGLRGPVLSTAMGPTGKIALVDLSWAPRILLLR